MNTPNPATAAAQPAEPVALDAAKGTQAKVGVDPAAPPPSLYPDIDAFNIPQLRELILGGIQARPGLHPDSVAECDRRLSYAHERIMTLKGERAAAKVAEPAQLRRLTVSEANHIAHMCTYGPADPLPLDQALMEMGLVEFYDDTDAIEQTKLAGDCLYGPDRLKYIPVEWMTTEERKRAGL